MLVAPYTRPEYAGSGIHAHSFAKFLLRKGYSAKILTFNRNRRLSSREIIEAVPVHRILYFNRNLFLKIVSLVLILPAYMKHVNRNDLIIIYGAHIIAYEFLIIWGRITGKTLVFRSLLLGADDLGTLVRTKTGLTRSLLPGIFRKLDLYMAINPVFAERYVKVTVDKEKLLICPQGVDVEFFRSADTDQADKLKEGYGIADDAFILLSVGFLINRKGFSEVFRAIRDFPFEFRYIIAGEYEFGPDHFMHRYAKEAEEIHTMGREILAEKLIFTGPVENIRDYYWMTDVVLINSSAEGLSNTLLEAMACGRVVLVKDLPGIRHIVRHMETGLVFQSEAEMIDLIRQLKSDPEMIERIGRRAAGHVQSTASFEYAWKRLSDALWMSEQ